MFRWRFVRSELPLSTSCLRSNWPRFAATPLFAGGCRPFNRETFDRTADWGFSCATAEQRPAENVGAHCRTCMRCACVWVGTIRTDSHRRIARNFTDYLTNDSPRTAGFIDDNAWLRSWSVVNEWSFFVVGFFVSSISLSAADSPLHLHFTVNSVRLAASRLSTVNLSDVSSAGSFSFLGFYAPSAMRNRKLVPEKRT